MAGGKETPRQKMIGMMYLVLTALLALQVSSAIIQKFVILNASLEEAVTEETARNVKAIENIKKSVEDRGNKPKEVQVVSNAKLVQQKTDELLKYMTGIKNDLITKSGGRDEAGNFVGAKEEEAVAVMMLGAEGAHNGKGYELKKKLNDYADFVSSLTPTKYGKIALDGKEDPIFKGDHDQRNKDFVQLNFESTPMVAALAVLSEKQSQLTTIEAEVLNTLAAEVGAADFKFDKLLPMVKPESKVIAAGTKYKAQMFITATSTTIHPTMKFRGADVKVDDNGVGTIEFKASGGNYDKEGMSKQTWKGEISMPKPGGGDTLFPISEEYIVAKPAIQIQSASVQALYKNCGNELNVQVPALGSVYNPSFTASGAQVIKGAQKGVVTLVPTAAKVTLNVSSDGSLVGSQDFNVRLIPKPTIECWAGAGPVNEKTGVPAPGPRALTMKAIPDESFKTFLPKDARYRISQWECILVRGKRPVKTEVFTSENGNLSSFASQAQPGDRILIDVKKVTRTNFLNQTEDVNLGTIIKNIPLN